MGRDWEMDGEKKSGKGRGRMVKGERGRGSKGGKVGVEAKEREWK